MPCKVAVGTVGGYGKIEEWEEGARLYDELVGDEPMPTSTRIKGKRGPTPDLDLRPTGFTLAPEIVTRNWLTISYAANAGLVSAGVELLHGTATAGGSAFLAAKKDQPGSSVFPRPDLCPL